MFVKYKLKTVFFSFHATFGVPKEKKRTEEHIKLCPGSV